MALTKDGYKKRIIDKKIDEYLKIFGAVSIEGPKWCGKTWTALNHANSVYYVGDPANDFNNRKLAQANTDNIFYENYPELIDEWQEVPGIWDAVRFKCDIESRKGKYILSGSATPQKKGVLHSGTGRIGKIEMYPMSLYESGDSNGIVSLKDLFNNKIKNNNLENVSLKRIAELAIRGGWPESIELNPNQYRLIPKGYINNVIESDISKIDGKERNKDKFKDLMYSLARNESTIVNNSTLLKDVEKSSNSIAMNTILDYLDILHQLYIIKDMESYTENIRSTTRVRSTPKRNYVDPSLACAMLDLTTDKLMNDLNTFGFIFESLCVRDLRIYIESLGGKIYHYRDNDDLEVDVVLEMEDGKIGLFEIKLGANEIDDAAKNLLKLQNKMDKIKPSVLCVIVGDCKSVYKREDGIYVVPILALKD